MLKLKKAIPCFVLLLVLLVTACSGKSPTKNTVDIPSAQNSQGNTNPAAGTVQATATLESYPATGTVKATPAQESYPASGTSPITVTKPDGTTTTLDPATLKGIKLSTVKSGTNSYQGIAVSAILVSAGVTDYKQITIIGANGNQILTKDKVNDNLILKGNSDGSLQLFSPDLPETAWLQAVNAIKAE